MGAASSLTSALRRLWREQRRLRLSVDDRALFERAEAYLTVADDQKVIRLMFYTLLMGGAVSAADMPNSSVDVESTVQGCFGTNPHIRRSRGWWLDGTSEPVRVR